MNVAARCPHIRNTTLAKRLLILITASSLFAGSATGETPVGINGAFIQTDMDNAGNIHMVYVSDAWMSSSYYTKFDGSGWTPPTGLPNSSPCWINFTKPAVAVGPDGLAQVAYGVYTGDIDNYPDFPNSLDYFFYGKDDPSGSGFNVQQIGPNGFRHSMYAIAVDDSNRPHIAYTRTNKAEPFYWQVIYFTPDNGTHKVVQHATNERYRPGQPRIAYGNGVVYIAWYQASAPSVHTDVWCASYDAWSGEELSFQKVSNVAGSGLFAGNVDVAVAPDGHAEISYLVADWNASPHPIYLGVYLTQPNWSDGHLLGEGEAWINEDEHEETWPNIDFDAAGNRYLAWYYYGNNETYYKFNSDPRRTMEPWGPIDLAAGSGGAYYVRVHGYPGPFYMESIGGVPNQAPVASFGFGPDSGDFTTVFSFDASSSYDPDGNIPLTYSWDWESDGFFEIVDDLSPNADHVYSYPGTYRVTLRVRDTLGATGAADDNVLVINHPPVAAFVDSQIGENTIRFDATGSLDLEDDAALMYRWDWDDDGEFERWTIFPTAVFEFSEPGIYPVTLEVKDQLDAVDDTTMSVEVEPTLPLPPSTLLAEDYPDDEGGAISLEWNLSPDDTSRVVVTEYLIRRQAVGQSDYVEFTVSAGETTYVDSVPTAVAFNYSIASYDGSYYSDWVEAPGSATAIDNTPPMPATDLEAPFRFIDPVWVVTLTWTPSISLDVITQSVYRMEDGDQWEGRATLQPTESTFSDTIVAVGTYHYKIGSSDTENIAFSDSATIETLGGEIHAGIPQEIVLQQVVPNPGRGTMVVRYALPTSGQTRLAIHDLKGSRVSVLHDGPSEPGWHAQTWVGRDERGRRVPAGLYLVRLTQGAKNQSIPVVVLP